MPSFLRFACIVRFLQRPSCPKFRLQGLYNLCPFPASPSARKPTCPRTCLDSASFFLPIFCSISIFCRFRVVFCFKFQALFSSLLRNCRLFLSPLPLFAFLSLFSHCPKKLSCPYRLYKSFAVFFYFSLVSSVFCKDPPVRNSVSEVFTVFAPLLHPRRSENQPVRPSLQSLCCLFTFRSCRSFPAKTFLSEIPSPWSLLSLLHACITISPKTDLSENLSRLRAVFPADLLFLLYILSLSRCFRFLVYKCSFSLISPFSSSLASFFFPCGLALAPLAFSLRLSVWKNFPFHIYINELTLSTLLRDKNNVPDFFLF